ncbi:MAG: permease prefix domain 1-containing protein [Acidobacteriota bacterium]|nr:permease prefix domain 1-containing protein [Acidobacteriota bacterium]
MAEAPRDLEAQFGQWRTYLRHRQAIRGTDVEELEGHLRDQVAALQDLGLDDDEAFLVAVKRLGSLDALSREFAREHSDRLWKQLVLAPGQVDAGKAERTDVGVVVALALSAAALLKLPHLFGFATFGPEVIDSFYARNLSLFVFPVLAGYFAWKRGLDRAGWGWLAGAFASSAAVVNLLPFTDFGNTEVLAVLHLPIAAWLVVGFAYVGGRWRSGRRRMDFVRFSGELFIYYVLMALGGGVLMVFTALMFAAIGLSAEDLVQFWILPCGAMGAVIVGAWLVEAKQSVVENMAPVLTRVFTPLFAILLLVFLATMLWTGSGLDVERELLIGFDLLLVLVLGLLLYAISARDPDAPPDAFDLTQLVLVASALLVDALALAAIASRISDFGFSPNKVAALGENLILLVNLGWSAVLYFRFLRGRSPYSALERWQTAYLPVYGIWALLVVVGFGPIFDFS